MKLDTLYLSPHPDDVAFSIAGRLSRDVQRGRTVGVLTLFEVVEEDAPLSNSPGVRSAALLEAPRAFLDAQARRLEDEQFAEHFGVSLLRANLPELICREAQVDLTRMPDVLSESAMAADAPLVQSTMNAIEPVLANGVEELVSPLAIGRHIDHQLTYAAARALARGRPALRLRFYEDTPYVLWPNRLASRLRELDAVVDDIFEHGNLMETKIAAVGCYATQWPLIYPTLDDWRGAFQQYALSQGRATPFERIWRLEPRTPQ